MTNDDVSQPLPSLAERQKTALADLSSFGRVSHRLALVDSSEKLQMVLDKLLPRLLKRIGENHQTQLEINRISKETLSSVDQQHQRLLQDSLSQIHSKLVEMLSHTMKRVRQDDKCKLPCRAVLGLLLDQGDSTTTSEYLPMKALPHVDPFTLNLTLAFLTLGVPRCTPHELEELLPGLLVLLGYQSGKVGTLESPSRKSQWYQLTHLILRALERIVESTENPLGLKRMPYTTTSTSEATKSSKRLKSSDQGEIKDETGSSSPSSMNLIRTVLQDDQNAAGALYNLLLDVLLYQTVAGNVPPPGLSQAGHERLRQGSSSTSRDWAAEMAQRSRLVQLKTRVLDFVSPNRRWAPFLNSTEKDVHVEDQTSLNKNMTVSLGRARTVALLVVATGDGTQEVSQLASQYLKQHMASFRGAANGEGSASKDASTYSSGDAVYGNIISLLCELLTLSVGATNAQLALSKTQSAGIPTLALQVDETPSSSSSTTTEVSQLVLSLKRRMVSDSVFAALATFTTKILEDSPHIFTSSAEVSTEQQRIVSTIGSLSVLATTKILSNLRTASGLSLLRGKPFISAAQLLNALVIRLCNLQETQTDLGAMASGRITDTVIPLMAKSLATACRVLATISTPRQSGGKTSNASNASEGNIATRDALYGVVCSLSRSPIVINEGQSYFLFAMGNSYEQNTSGANVPVSVDTASLLFGCAANEEEVLRPRAVAALDALLAAYCRIYKETDKRSQVVEPESISSNAEAAIYSTLPEPNPWTTMDVSSSKPSSQSVFIHRQLASALLPLIWTASQPSQPKASRVAAARWSSDLLKTIDLANASHLLCFLAGDTDVTSASIAREGLGFKLTSSLQTAAAERASNSNQSDSEKCTPVLPDFSEMIALLFPESNDRHTNYWRPRYWDFSPLGKAAAVHYTMDALLNDLYGGDNDAIKTFVAALLRTLSEVAALGREYIELLDECARCLSICFSTSSYARSLLRLEVVKDIELPLKLQDLEDLTLTANSSRARRFLAEACGYLYEDESFWPQRREWTKSLQRALEVCAKEIELSRQHSGAVGNVHGAAFLGATYVRTFRLNPDYHASEEDASDEIASCWNLSCRILSALGDGTLHKDDIVSNAFSDGLSIALAYNSQDAPILDQRLYTGTTTALVKLWKALHKYGSGDQTNAPRASKLAHATGVCLAASTSGAGTRDSGSESVEIDGVVYYLGPARLQCVDALFSLLGSTAFRKDEEIALVAGEALAQFADAFSPRDATWTSEAESWPADLDEEFAKELPPHQQVLYTLLRRTAMTSNHFKRTSCAPALLAVVARAACGVNRHTDYVHRSLVKEIRVHLSEVQNAFIALLADPKCGHLARESACLGLVACRGLAGFSNDTGDDAKSASETLNEKLLRAFGQTSNYGGSAMMETVAQANERRRANASTSQEGNSSAAAMMESFGAETEVGGASGLGEAALGAFREMAAAAVALGRPDVLYNLLILSVSHTMWFTSASRERYSASALLGKQCNLGNQTNSAEMREALRPHLGKLLPRMLRACHDPNKDTRERMSNLFVGVTGGGAEARLAITQHLIPTIDTLINEASSKLWRARCGACGALSQVIVARSWEDLGGGPPVLDDDDILDASNKGAGARLLRLWRVAMRSLDDVRGNVRESGEKLARTVKSLTIRLCDPSADDSANGMIITKEDIARRERDASSAAATSLRWFLKHGLNQACPEATGVCVACLVGIVDVVNPSILQPLLPDLLRSLLFAMSGLEPAALSYLQVRAAGQDENSGSYDRLERLRLQLANSGPLATAVTKCLDMLPNVDLDTQKAVIPQLDAALRLSAGFASRAATADAVSTLCSTCPHAFKFSGSSSTNPSVRLLRALYFASERERGQAARDKMAHALGNIASLCPGSSVRSLALRACSRYSTHFGNFDDQSARRAAAVALRSMAVRASNQFSDGGTSDVWCRRVLPVAFLGMKDSDEKVASLWKEVWEEGGSAANLAGAIDDFGSLLEEKLLPNLVNECVKALEDVSWSRRIVGSIALAQLADMNVLAPAPRSINSAALNNIENQERSRRRAQASNHSLVALVKLMSGARLWSGKNEVIKAAVKVASKWSEMCSDHDQTLELFGVDSEIKRPSLQPITVSPGRFENDLFVGDCWFAAARNTEIDEDGQCGNTETADMDIDEETNEVKIDFDEGDKLLEGENQNEAMGTESEKEEAHGVVTFTGLCRNLLRQAFPSSERSLLSVSEDEVLPYRAEALKALKELLESITGASQRQELFRLESPKLISVFDIDGRFHFEKNGGDEPPLIVARSIDCLSSCLWDGVGNASEIPTLNTLELIRVLQTCGGPGQAAWTVRESAALCCEAIASRCHSDALRQPHATISTLVECFSQALKDRKFWRVRLAGLKLLRALVRRAGDASANPGILSSAGSASDSEVSDKQLVLEAALPYKETMLKLARLALTDSEAKVTALSSEILSAMAWWP